MFHSTSNFLYIVRMCAIYPDSMIRSLQFSRYFLHVDAKKVELIDLRGVATGLVVSDATAPFYGVYSIASHEYDPFLIALSCPG